MLKTFADGRWFGASHGGAEPWVLALPGWVRTHRDFDAVLVGLDAISLDLPGFGAAPRPDLAWTTADYAEHVAPVLDQMAPRVVVVGHSFGGRVALHLAAARPDRIAALVLTGVPLVRPPGATPRAPALRYRVGRALHRRGLLRDTWMEHLRNRYGSEDYRRASGTMRDVLVKAVNETYQAQLAGFAGPIELVWGANDDQVPVSVAEAAMASCREPSLSVIPAVGHFLPLEAPEALIEAVNRHRPLTPGPPPDEPARPERDRPAAP